MSFNGRIGHVDGIESPFAIAGGFVKTTNDVLIASRTGIGHIEDGSHVLGDKRLGNAWNPNTEEFDRNVHDYNSATGETGNSLGMPGEGFDAVMGDVPERIKIAHAHGKPYILNIAPVTDNPTEEVVEMTRRAYEAGVDGVLINAGCPNVLTEDGGRHELLSRSPSGLYAVLSGVRRAHNEGHLPKPVWLRMSPQESYNRNMVAIGTIIRQSGIVSAVFTPNTWPEFVPKTPEGENILDVPNGEGGRSGPATADLAFEQTNWAICSLVNSGIDTVSSGGIMTAKELKRRLDLGAVAGAGTTFFYEPIEGIAGDVDRMLHDLADIEA